VTDEDDWEPGPEDEAQRDRFYALAGRHPTFLIVMKIVHSRARLRSLLRMAAPEMVVENERQILDKRLDELCAAMPYDAAVSTYPLPDIIEHFRQEILNAPGTGDDA